MLVSRGAAGTSTLWAQNSISTKTELNKTYTASLRMWVPSSNPSNGGIRVSGSSVVALSESFTTLRDQWVRVSVTFTRAAVTGGAFFYINGGNNPDREIWIDGPVTIIEGTSPGPEFDGDTPDTETEIYAWTGAANSSTSTLTRSTHAGSGLYYTLIARWQDPNNMWQLRLASDNLRLTRIQNGSAIDYTTIAVSPTIGQEFQLVAQGTTLYGYVDGTPLISVEDPWHDAMYATAGVGMQSSLQRVDDLQATSLSPALPAQKFASLQITSKWRYYAQRILTGEWLDRDLDLTDVSLTWALSGPGALTAKVDPVLAPAVSEDGLMLLEEWSTAIYAEANGQIRWGGLLHTSADAGGGTRSLECIGFAGYPKGRIYDSKYRLWEADPFDVVRVLWDYVQSDRNGDLGVTVDDDKCPVKLGDPAPGPRPLRSDYDSAKEHNKAVTEWANYGGEPYELAWWNSQDCGDEIDNVIAEAGAEYMERHWWQDAEKTQVRHHIELGYPHIGTRRDDLRFVEGENVMVPPAPSRNGDTYASHIVALGAGEERFMLREHAELRENGRLRRDKVLGMKDVMSFKRLKKAAEDELVLSRDIVSFDTFEVIDHPNAPLGAWSVGDEITVQTFSGFQELNRSVRVVEMTMSPETSDSITVSVTRL